MCDVCNNEPCTCSAPATDDAAENAGSTEETPAEGGEKTSAEETSTEA